jgi:hypothetical protein
MIRRSVAFDRIALIIKSLFSGISGEAYLENVEIRRGANSLSISFAMIGMDFLIL